MSKVVLMRSGSGTIKLSAIVSVTGRYDDPDAVYQAYRAALEATGHSYEIIYVLDFPVPDLEARISELQAQGEPLHVIRLTQRFGEAVNLRVGFQFSSGELIVSLPPYFQIEPEAIPLLVAALDDADLVVASRDRRGDHWLHRIRYWGLQRMASFAGFHVQDLGCLVRAFRRRVLNEVILHDEHHRFLPLLAQQAGFTVKELDAAQAPSDRRLRLHSPAAYLGRLLDILAVTFLIRFMQRPFRFFGSVGFVMASLGLALGSVMVVQRLFFHVPLADRPALLLAALLVVLGIQIGAVGLVAEIIIFTHAGRRATSQVDRVVERDQQLASRGQSTVDSPSL